MHVLITADTVGGVWTYVRELVTELAHRGIRITLVSFGDIPAPQQTAWLEGLQVDFRPTAFRLEWMQDCEADLARSAEYLSEVIAEVKPELLHLNQYFYGSVRAEVPRVVVAHSDVITWWHAVHDAAPPESHWLGCYRDLVAQAISGADAVVAPSQWMLDSLATHYVRPARAWVIHNGRSPLLFNPYVEKSDYALTVGRLWDSGKQVTLLAEQELPLTTYIVGSEVHPDVAFRGSARLIPARKSKAIFKGPQSEAELRQLYTRASLYIGTSRYEPFGLAPVEAALSRCALVLNDIPTFRELWGETALYFEQNDGESLRRAVELLHADRDTRLACANLAYRHALQYFSAKRMADDYLKLYQTVASGRAVAA